MSKRVISAYQKAEISPMSVSYLPVERRFTTVASWPLRASVIMI